MRDETQRVNEFAAERPQTTATTRRYLPFMSGLFTPSLLISVSIAGKIFILGPFTLSASVLVFPLAFLFADLLTEVYGYSDARKVIWTGFFCEALLAIFYHITVLLPAPSFFTAQDAYAIVLRQAPRVV
jgi:queuosine precursor transporter